MKKKLLIIDRDGTIIKEPPVDYQVDSLEKLEFVPGAITALSRIAALHDDYLFVLASNQDGLGTPSFPTETFVPAHEKMLTTLRGEGFEFDRQLIDPSLPEEDSPARKPGTAMFTALIESGEYDIAGSLVIGDRLTDVMLARNLGCRAILFDPEGETSRLPEFEELADTCVLVARSWSEIAEFVRASSRRVSVSRKTRETDISLTLDLDGRGPSGISTGLKFFDHMLDQIAHHSGCSLALECRGDLEVDEHHTIEDVAIVLGGAIARAIGDKRGMDRYGFALPMDECRALVVLDFGGRADFDWDVSFTREYVGDVPTEMFRHFFQSLCHSMNANLHIKAVGENNHHLAESVFKGFARALKAAVRRDVFSDDLPSSKGML
ncbi:MAG: bifunctional histidinol-phosphatase/imidazoleglycerol-phosphate dehydratase HisB [Muribaculaceae bacterium]|nr:bifunctional histidinol-phosphatase/imidazoleglycerol-phosphate dehydratase HisB [Muribaculaceae bacterium]